VLYGHFIATVSMRSGAPMMGTPELGLMNYMIGQLARKYGVPWRSSGMLCGSKLVDAQAAYESVQNMYAVLLAGANYVLHAAGWLEAGLTASFAKFVLDAEQVAMFHRLGQGPRFEDFEEALQAMREVGPGGHYLGSAHTQTHFQSAFFMPELLDNNSYEQWLADGARDAPTRALEAAGPHARGLRGAGARPRGRGSSRGVHRRARGGPARQHGLIRRLRGPLPRRAVGRAGVSFREGRTPSSASMRASRAAITRA